MTGAEAQEIVSRLVNQLGEHFEAVQVMVSWNEEGETRCNHNGSGNWYARQGMAREFLQFEEAQIIAREVGKKLEEIRESDEDDE